MKWCDLTSWEQSRLHVMCVVMVVVAEVLVVLPVESSNLQGDPLVLQPPANQKGLHFGFSLAHYTTNNQRWLLVGAPRSNISRPDVAHSGGLYKCQLNGGNVCNEMKVNVNRPESFPIWAINDNTDQGLGFSLASDGESIVVCAPQWYAERSKYNEKNYLPAGMCFAAKSPGYEFTGFSPPFDGQKVKSMSYLNTGSCQFGLSAAHLKDQNTFALGAPGCWTWRGDTWEVGLGSTSDLELDKRYLGENIWKDDNSDWDLYSHYMGYSVAGFKFAGQNGIVSSIPRTDDDNDEIKADTMEPTILILTRKPDDQNTLMVNYRISPSKMISDGIRYAFFGYSLATLDLNGDGLEDLVVGAPFYVSSFKDFYDQGAIFVYMQTVNEKQAYQMIEEDNAPQRKGSVSFSRFGSCVAAIGDLDGDGYEDLAVGAPFMAVGSDEEAGTGVVYIYMGSENGLEKDDTRQIIKAAAKQFGFGSSMAQQLPSIDGQGYDVAVGAYDSDTVLVFKSKEVVDVIWNMAFDKKIDLSNNECICAQFGQLCPCVDMRFCLKYHKKIIKYDNNVKLNFNITLSTANEELFFTNEKTELQEKFEVQEDEDYCQTFQILAKPDIEHMRLFIINGVVSFNKEEKQVALNRHAVLTKNEQLPIVIHCESIDVSGCKSDIILQYDILDNYVLMTPQAMKIHFNVKNQGETAYDSRLYIRSSDAFKVNAVEGDEITCEESDKKEIECKIGRLNNNVEVHFNVSLKPSSQFLSSLDTHGPSFNMTAEVETLSALSNPDTAVKQISAPIDVVGSLQLTKQSSQPVIVYFNSSSYYKSATEAKSEEELGPEIKHIYAILNRNKFSIYEAQLTVRWPHTIDDKSFLYLMENLSFNGMSHNCQYPSGLVDPSHLNPTTQTQGIQRPKEGTSALAMGIGDKSPKYKIITCSLGEIRASKQITVTIRSRLVLRTLVELEVGTAVKNASSFVELEITKMPLNYDVPIPSSSSINTAISYKNANPEATIPVWLYIVSAVGGLLLLAIIIVILWKCGFFKRKRGKTPDNANDKEEEQLTKKDEGEQEMEQKEEEEEVKTPISPMLKDTESASADFVFHRT